MSGMTDILEAWFSAKMETVHTCLPGKILSYSGHSTRKARVQPLIRLELGTGPILDIPPIDGVPVVFQSSQEGAVLFPVKAGDTCLLVFSEAGIGRWLLGRGDLADPDSQDRHSLTDAIAIPGLFPFQGVPKLTVPEDAMWVGFKGASLTLTGNTFSLKDAKGNSIESSGTTLTLNNNLEVDQ